MNQQLVTAVMVTGNPGRRALAEAAIKSFQLQTWDNKELLIVDDSGAEWPSMPNVRVAEMPQTQERLTLGALRNIGLAQARGDWIIQWDDDDWYHEQRIKFMMGRTKPGYAVTLRRQIRYSFLTNNAFVNKYRFAAGLPGSIIHPKTTGRYQEIGKHEDSRFINDHFPDRLLVVDNIGPPGPELYLRFHHGENTWDHSHIMGSYAKKGVENLWHLSADQAKYLKKILKEHYST
jgi:glycosyltransferase involved in cell wall biosynthesis